MKAISIRFILALIMISALENVQGQMIDNERGQAFENEDFFNREFIRQNGIDRIVGEIMMKRNDRPITPEYQNVIYDFNKDGQLTMIAYIRGKRKRDQDTSATYYAYDPQGNLAAIGRTESGGYGTRKFDYDEKGRVIKKTYQRTKNSNGDKLSYRQGKNAVTINSERMEYQEFDNGYKRTTFNSVDRPYLEEIVLYDSLGYLKSHNTRYVVTQRRTSTDFDYNEHGWVSQRRSTDIQGDTTRFTFEYDEVGNLLSREEFEDGMHKKHCEVVYLRDTMLPRAWLCKNKETGDIRIIRYSYDFYEYPEKQ